MHTNMFLAVAMLGAALTWTGCELGAGDSEVNVEAISGSKMVVTGIDDFECFRAEVQSAQQPPVYVPQDAGATEKVVNGEATIPVAMSVGEIIVTKVRLTIPEDCGSVNGEIEYRGDPNSNVHGPLPFTFISGDTQTFPRHTFK